MRGHLPTRKKASILRSNTQHEGNCGQIIGGKYNIEAPELRNHPTVRVKNIRGDCLRCTCGWVLKEDSPGSIRCVHLLLVAGCDRGGGSSLNIRGSHSYTCMRLPPLPASIICRKPTAKQKRTAKRRKATAWPGALTRRYKYLFPDKGRIYC